MIPINNSNRSPREFRAGIPPGLPQYTKLLVHHTLRNSKGTDVSDNSPHYPASTSHKNTQTKY